MCQFFVMSQKDPISRMRNAQTDCSSNWLDHVQQTINYQYVRFMIRVTTMGRRGWACKSEKDGEFSSRNVSFEGTPSYEYFAIRAPASYSFRNPRRIRSVIRLTSRLYGLPLSVSKKSMRIADYHQRALTNALR